MTLNNFGHWVTSAAAVAAATTTMNTLLILDWSRNSRLRVINLIISQLSLAGSSYETDLSIGG